MEAHHIEATLKRDGRLTLDGLPFRAGETVEVTIASKTAPKNASSYPLRGTPVGYVDPFEPVAADDWDAAG